MLNNNQTCTKGVPEFREIKFLHQYSTIKRMEIYNFQKWWEFTKLQGVAEYKSELVIFHF